LKLFNAFTMHKHTSQANFSIVSDFVIFEPVKSPHGLYSQKFLSSSSTGFIFQGDRSQSDHFPSCSGAAGVWCKQTDGTVGNVVLVSQRAQLVMALPGGIKGHSLDTALCPVDGVD